MSQCDRRLPGDDPEDPDSPKDPKLKFPTGRFEEPIINLIFAAQISLGAMAIFTFLFWAWLVLGSWYHPWMLKPGMFWEYFDIDWYPDVLGLALLMVIPVIFLHYLYE
ncbi:hypothetical protein [Halegenticoccus soli]|uniref:hypothetical protein n=1 Tax=Halegenticoccus soli TaxID=1985678 RepID=UPI00117AC4FD|nr:hypothetical protein [Halegenticoccus soli]